jgi:23S rRNA maturation mini-RNase III
VSNDVANDRLVVMPAYWFMYNLYALARNAGKYEDRDKRTLKEQYLEYDYLAPDSVNEMFDALRFFRDRAAETLEPLSDDYSNQSGIEAGERLLNDSSIDWKDVVMEASGFENTSRKVVLLKMKEAYDIFKRLIAFYGVQQLFTDGSGKRIDSITTLKENLPTLARRLPWVNIGGQLMPEESRNKLFDNIHNNTISSWEDVHAFYKETGARYLEQKRMHAIASLLEVKKLSHTSDLLENINQLLNEFLETKRWMVNCIRDSRTKDYQNAFRKMVYNNETEMEEVIGKIDDNIFIQQQEQELKELARWVQDFS